jgi:Cytochrome c
MKKRPFLLALIIVTLIVSYRKFYYSPSPDLLSDEPQVFQIHPGTDTMVICRNGTVLKFCQTTFQTDAKTITLEVKEVLTTSAMMRNRTNTITTDGQLLESAGMVYFNVTEPKGVPINRDYPVEIRLPAREIIAGLQLFKGKDTKEGIVWEAYGGATSGFNNAEMITKIVKGSDLYTANCAACHYLNTPLSGPPLGKITSFVSREWLYKFTLEPSNMITSGDQRAVCIWETWKPSLMNDFPNLSQQDVSDIYDFIEAASLRMNIEASSASFACSIDTSNIRKEPAEIINPNAYEMSAYIFRTFEYGWYNCDAFLNQKLPPVQMKVKVSTPQPFDEIQVFLVFKNRKMNFSLYLQRSGEFSINNSLFPDYSVPFPMEPATMVAIGRRGSDFFMTKYPFIIQSKNDINLTLTPMPKKEIDAVLKVDEEREKAGTINGVFTPGLKTE